MKKIILITTMAFIAGLFTVGQGLGSGDYGSGKTSEESSAQVEETGKHEMAAVSLDSKQISELQRILSDKGYEVGAIDGVIGESTEKALRDFQTANELAVTGNPDKETLRALAPDAETQEFFGLSPEFGEKEMEHEKPVEEKGSSGSMKY
jgi:peptidoglycan hydrolase-like protein with peptidoglycan-binding domain